MQTAKNRIKVYLLLLKCVLFSRPFPGEVGSELMKAKGSAPSTYRQNFVSSQGGEVKSYHTAHKVPSLWNVFSSSLPANLCSFYLFFLFFICVLSPFVCTLFSVSFMFSFTSSAVEQPFPSEIQTVIRIHRSGTFSLSLSDRDLWCCSSVQVHWTSILPDLFCWLDPLWETVLRSIIDSFIVLK